MIGNVSELNIVIEEVYVSKLNKSRNIFNNYLEVKECILHLGYNKMYAHILKFYKYNKKWSSNIALNQQLQELMVRRSFF